MGLRKRWLLAMGFAAVACMAAGTGSSELPVQSNDPGLPVQFQFKKPDALGVGKLLVASRNLGDPGFAGTVILLVRYDASAGVLGLVLNRRTDVPLSEVLDLKSARDRSDPVYAGGPVEPRAVFALFKSAAKVEKAESIFGRVYLISDKDLFDQTLSAHPEPSAFRVYLGYTGWTVAQLRHEVELGSWYIFPGDANAVFSADPSSLWLEMIQETKVQVVGTEPLAGRPGRAGVDAGPIPLAAGPGLPMPAAWRRLNPAGVADQRGINTAG